jgi:hypothetical protein
VRAQRGFFRSWALVVLLCLVLETILLLTLFAKCNCRWYWFLSGD